jgi:hypothetical protein
LAGAFETVSISGFVFAAFCVLPPVLLGGAQFLSNWNGITVGDLFERIRKSMPQSNPGKLTRKQAADVIAYVLSFNKFPEGDVELRPMPKC